MFVGPLLAALFGAVLWGALVFSGLTKERSRLVEIVFGGYVLRLVIQFFIRDVRLFSHAAGGDSLLYELYGKMIAALWRTSGIKFVTSAEIPEFGATSLPPNLFGTIFYLNGGEPTRLGGTALVALAAALTVVNMYLLAVQFGAEKRNALLLVTLFYFEPAFLYYTSDLYKDGLVLCFTIGALGSALRLGHRLSLWHALVGVVCVWALWYVRFYLIFVTVAPFLVGIVGLRSKNASRPLIAALVLLVAGVALATFTDILQMAGERANATFAVATSDRVMDSNAAGGSGVDFDDGGDPLGMLHLKLAYTLFSPFPWAAGSLGFQLGKLEVFLWYFVVYRAYKAARKVDRRLLLMLATFVVPCTMMYAMTMSNVGLIVRQRLVIVAATVVLASVYTPVAKVRLARSPAGLRGRGVGRPVSARRAA